MPNTSSRPVMFTTKTCPNCKMAKMLLSKAGIEVEVIDATENGDLTKKYGVTKAPTMFVTDKTGNTIKLENISDIKKYIEGNV